MKARCGCERELGWWVLGLVVLAVLVATGLGLLGSAGATVLPAVYEPSPAATGWVVDDAVAFDRFLSRPEPGYFVDWYSWDWVSENPRWTFEAWDTAEDATWMLDRWEQDQPTASDFQRLLAALPEGSVIFPAPVYGAEWLSVAYADFAMAQVPEPSGLFLFLAGLALVVFFLRGRALALALIFLPCLAWGEWQQTATGDPESYLPETWEWWTGVTFDYRLDFTSGVFEGEPFAQVSGSSEGSAWPAVEYSAVDFPSGSNWWAWGQLFGEYPPEPTTYNAFQPGWTEGTTYEPPVSEPAGLSTNSFAEAASSSSTLATVARSIFTAILPLAFVIALVFFSWRLVARRLPAK